MPKHTKRAHQRYQCDLPVQIIREDGEITLRAVNISLGGMLVEPAENLTFGSAIKVKFQLPSVSFDTEVESVVRWIKDNKAGLQFGSLRAKDVRALNKLFRPDE